MLGENVRGKVTRPGEVLHTTGWVFPICYMGGSCRNHPKICWGGVSLVATMVVRNYSYKLGYNYN